MNLISSSFRAGTTPVVQPIATQPVADQRGFSTAVLLLKRLPAVLAACGRSRSSFYSDIQKGLFTQPVRLGLRAVGWPAAEVDAIIAARIAGKTDEQIKSLVAHLMQSRQEVVYG